MGFLLLTIASRFLFPLLSVFALYMLLGGHHAPGGGFAAGLVVAAALALYMFASPRGAERELLSLAPHALIAIGLLTVAVSGLVGLLAGKPFLTKHQIPVELKVGLGLHLSTPLLFDFGVALVASGAAFVLLLALEERAQWKQ